jgi:hypothetical protein
MNKEYRMKEASMTRLNRNEEYMAGNQINTQDVTQDRPDLVKEENAECIRRANSS